MSHGHSNPGDPGHGQRRAAGDRYREPVGGGGRDESVVLGGIGGEEEAFDADRFEGVVELLGLERVGVGQSGKPSDLREVGQGSGPYRKAHESRVCTNC